MLKTAENPSKKPSNIDEFLAIFSIIYALIIHNSLIIHEFTIKLHNYQKLNKKTKFLTISYKKKLKNWISSDFLLKKSKKLNF